MQDRRFRNRGWVCVALLLALGGGASWAQESQPAQVHGSLTEIKGVPVLKVWGTPREQGYAHGYLLAERIVRLFDRMLADGVILTPESFERQLLAHLDLMKIDPSYEAELRGMLAGIEARLGRPAEIPSLGRALRYEDLAAVNCIDLKAARFGCSSFVAWGPMTKDGRSLCGRNLEWPADRALLESQIVLVHLPATGSSALGWVSVFFPACIGCATAMNAEGVVMAQHDAMGRPPTLSKGFTSRSLMQRAALEATHAGSALKDAAAVFKQQHSFLGENMLVAWPSSDHGPAAVVFEHDADLGEGDGVTTREPKASDAFLVCTNHYRQRQAPTACPRFSTLTSRLQAIAESKGRKRVTVKTAWKLLESAPIEQLATYHRVVFEPDRKRMHVGFPKNGDPKSRGKVITLDVSKLLESPTR